nr:MAG TPA: hypothetical protein [Caudoviricetes sp.]
MYFSIPATPLLLFSFQGSVSIHRRIVFKHLLFTASWYHVCSTLSTLFSNFFNFVRFVFCCSLDVPIY